MYFTPSLRKKTHGKRRIRIMVKSTEGIIEEMERISGDTGYDKATAIEIVKLRRFERIADALERIETEVKKKRR